jgi:hypothetical protein
MHKRVAVRGAVLQEGRTGSAQLARSRGLGILHPPDRSMRPPRNRLFRIVMGVVENPG